MKIGDKFIDELIAHGLAAPSGDNCQPWIFRRRERGVDLIIDSCRGAHFLAMRERPSLISHGAVIENISIAAHARGLDLDVQYPDRMAQDGVTATLDLRERGGPPDPLFPFIVRRATNRKPYSRRRLAPEARLALVEAARAPGAEFYIREDRIDEIAEIVSLNEKFLIELRGYHDDLFRWIRWTRGQAEKSRDGLYIKTLELGIGAAGLALLRPWLAARGFGALHLTRLLCAVSRSICRDSAAVGFLQMKGRTERDYLEGGRLLQRIWLTATAQGLSFQPMAGILFLVERLNGDPLVFSVPQQKILRQAETALKDLLGWDSGKAPILLFRVGYAEPPSAFSLRRPAGWVL
ncbi:MAG: nitroreductase family protein [Elusimicrobia bacterium]|nr:nitroreductase family protein [Elusimicrobiota bacterium]